MTDLKENGSISALNRKLSAIMTGTRIEKTSCSGSAFIKEFDFFKHAELEEYMKYINGNAHNQVIMTK